ncbi:hypothetical protein C8J57DRAFT_1459557 [Mycena rebaudengoi]|nr:hypothetical protein C8J57DRAFT_1459557 [Mycena rebaudengoi]
MSWRGRRRVRGRQRRRPLGGRKMDGSRERRTQNDDPSAFMTVLQSAPISSAFTGFAPSLVVVRLDDEEIHGQDDGGGDDHQCRQRAPPQRLLALTTRAGAAGSKPLLRRVRVVDGLGVGRVGVREWDARGGVVVVRNGKSRAIAKVEEVADSGLSMIERWTVGGPGFVVELV